MDVLSCCLTIFSSTHTKITCNQSQQDSLDIFTFFSYSALVVGYFLKNYVHHTFFCFVFGRMCVCLYFINTLLGTDSAVLDDFDN